MMAAIQEADHSDGYFNDLTRPGSNLRVGGNSTRSELRTGLGETPRTKRIACVICRKRKLRCDGVKPSCGSCSRLAHDCAYDEVRKKSGPKRGYVKLLEARLAQVESLLSKAREEPAAVEKEIAAAQEMMTFDEDLVRSETVLDPSERQFPSHRQVHHIPDRGSTRPIHHTTGTDSTHVPGDMASSWEMIALGLDEPLPPQDIVDELNEAFFERIYPTIPMIHRLRYYMAMNHAPHLRPAICLRYAMWASAALVMDKFKAFAEPFYIRARKYLEQDEMRGRGEGIALLAHCQTWVLIATYEYQNMLFPRAWLSVGRACRLATMMSLNRIDGAGPEIRQVLPPPRDWTELEERRRTFWSCFGADRLASVGTGWPMAIDERDITTKLPTHESAFEAGDPIDSLTLAAAFESEGSVRLPSIAAVQVLTCLFGRNLNHTFRPVSEERENNPTGDFWNRHMNMDNILSTIALMLPDELRLPAGMSDPNVIFLNLGIHTAAICIHQAAISRDDDSSLSSRTKSGSRARCLTAATEVTNIMRQISHLDFSSMNAFVPFHLYTSARVFVQHLRTKPNDLQARASLRFLISVLKALKRKNPLAESFLIHVDFELMGSGAEDLRIYRDSEPSDAAMFLARKAQQAQQHRSEADLLEHVDPCGPLSTNARSSGLGPPTDQACELPSRQRSPSSFGNRPGSNKMYEQMDTSPDVSRGGQLTPSSDPASRIVTLSPKSVSSRIQEQPFLSQDHQILSTPKAIIGQTLAKHGTITIAATHGDGDTLPTWNEASMGFIPLSTDGPDVSHTDVLNGISDAEWSHMLNNFGDGNINQLG